MNIIKIPLQVTVCKFFNRIKLHLVSDDTTRSLFGTPLNRFQLAYLVVKGVFYNLGLLTYNDEARYRSYCYCSYPRLRISTLLRKWHLKNPVVRSLDSILLNRISCMIPRFFACSIPADQRVADSFPRYSCLFQILEELQYTADALLWQVRKRTWRPRSQKPGKAQTKFVISLFYSF